MEADNWSSVATDTMQVAGRKPIAMAQLGPSSLHADSLCLQVSR